MPLDPNDADRGHATMSLQTAADRLGVHYQTAYRWVRDGGLRAEKVRGRYRVTAAEVVRVADERDRPRPPRPRTVRDPGRVVDQVFSQLVDGAEFSVRSALRGLAEQGMGVGDIIDSVLAPVARMVGDGWHAGAIPIPVEHRATAILERALADLMPNPRGRRRGTAAVAGVSGEAHALPLLMATAVLREDHWHVEHLGTDVPPEDIVAFGAAHEIDLFVLTSTSDTSLLETEHLARRLRDGGHRVLVGRPGASLDRLRADARSSEV